MLGRQRSADIVVYVGIRWRLRLLITPTDGDTLLFWYVPVGHRVETGRRFLRYSKRG